MTRSYASMRNGSPSTRRDLLKGATAAAAVASLAGGAKALGADAGTARKSAKEGRLNQSVCRWCYSKIPLDELCVGRQADGPGRHRPAHGSPTSRRSRSTA